MAKNILKEAIADAKAVRQVALANAKAALEEAFTPKLQSMLSARLSEDLEEDYYEEDSDRPGMTDIYIRKHRNGPIGRIELHFKKEQMKFYDVDKAHSV